MMSKIDWSKSPEWATCVVKRPGLKGDYHWSEDPKNDGELLHIQTGSGYTMGNPNCWEIVEKRPAVINPKMKLSQNTIKWEDFDDAPNWATCIVLNKVTNTFAWSDGSMYAPILRNPPTAIHNVDDFEIVAKRPADTAPDVTVTRVNDDSLTESLRRPAIPQMEAQPNCRCTFTPVQQPSTASDLLKQAEQLLTERGEQYDTSGQERSSAKIVAAFNTITGRDLTPGEGWLFLMLLKAVRFYSNTETPHRDSLKDLISYAALHAEEHLNDER